MDEMLEIHGVAIGYNPLYLSVRPTEGDIVCREDWNCAFACH